MPTRLTLSEVAWPSAESFAVLANAWASDATARMLNWVWDGYERLIADLGGAIHSVTEAVDLERDITQLLEPRVRDAMPDFVPFYLQHAVFERETRLAAPAQPPCYDLAFVLYANPRIAWPLEAKVMKHETDVTRYVADVREQFLTCRYAPFCSNAAMLGYLLSGETSAAFDAIQRSLGASLEEYPSQPGRPHRVSMHERDVPPGKSYPRQFSCHHLMMRFQLAAPVSLTNDPTASRE